jgi:4-carboxymuconolactone decarboxylase
VMQANREPIRSDRRIRGEEMLERVDGRAGIDVVESLASSFPEFANYVLEYPFGDIYSRRDLGMREREIASVAALCAMGSAAPQLRVHIHAALNVGCTPQEIQEVLMQMSVYAGFPAALNGLTAMKDVFDAEGIQLPLR